MQRTEYDHDLKPRAEYIWLDSNNQFRSKTRTLDNYSPTSYGKSLPETKELPLWTYDGSSTGQADGKNSEVILVPVKIVPDPFRKTTHYHNVLVLCDIILPGSTELKSSRTKALELHNKHIETEPWFAFEQEYTFLRSNGIPLGFNEKGECLRAQGPYYCGLGCNNSFGREIVEEHYDACLFSELDITGINAEVMPGQWEYQIRAVGIDSGDQLLLARYIMERICEKHKVIPSLEPKPEKDWNGAGCHVNFSTKKMRSEGGYSEILKAINKLEGKHKEHISVYGKDNYKRLTGLHETSSIENFSFGVADRGASVRIPRMTEHQGKGYFEDRRPASNCDPYEVIWRMLKTVLEEKEENGKE